MAFVWGERTKGASTTAEVSGRGVRLMLSVAGDVVGIEVLGWNDPGSPASCTPAHYADARSATSGGQPATGTLRYRHTHHHPAKSNWAAPPPPTDAALLLNAGPDHDGLTVGGCVRIDTLTMTTPSRLSRAHG